MILCYHCGGDRCRYQLSEYHFCREECAAEFIREAQARIAELEAAMAKYSQAQAKRGRKGGLKTSEDKTAAARRGGEANRLKWLSAPTLKNAKIELQRCGTVTLRGVTVTETYEQSGNSIEYTGRYMVYVAGEMVAECDGGALPSGKAWAVAKKYFQPA